MISLKKNKYNLFLGVILGFFLAQIVMFEGYAIIAVKQQKEVLSDKALKMNLNFFHIIAVIVFIITILIFLSKKLRKINFDKLGIYLILSIILSLVIAIEFVVCIMWFIFKIYPNIVELVQKNYFISINMFYLICFIGTIVFLVIFLILVNKKVKYIKFLANEITKFKNNGFGNEIQIKGKDELAHLCENINQMSVELKKKIDNEKNIEKTKNEMITNISHDLKTPLTAIIGYLELLEKREFNEEDKTKYTKIAYNKSLRLKGLVDELFEYTKLNNYDIKLNIVRFNISTLINQAVGESILDFSEKNILVILENPYKEILCDIDVKLIMRVFENLIKNAEKYADKDSKFIVNVQVEEKKLQIKFMNKCKGLSKESLEKIFEKFYRLDTSRNSTNEGTGLGLNIAQKIIELHQGKINVSKEEDNIIFEIILDIIEA